jgi:hypothetical protein
VFFQAEVVPRVRGERGLAGAALSSPPTSISCGVATADPELAELVVDASHMIADGTSLL